MSPVQVIVSVCPLAVVVPFDTVPTVPPKAVSQSARFSNSGDVKDVTADAPYLKLLIFVYVNEFEDDVINAGLLSDPNTPDEE